MDRKCHQNALREIRSSPLRMLKYCVMHPSAVAYFSYLYVLDRIYSGSYPSDERQTLDLNAKKENFQLKHSKDLTFDYMKTSLLNPAHFGRTDSPMTADRVFVLGCMIFTSPFWWHMWISHFRSHWMGQFGEKGAEPSEEELEKNSVVRLWWHMWEYKPESVKAA